MAPDRGSHGWAHPGRLLPLVRVRDDRSRPARRLSLLRQPGASDRFPVRPRAIESSEWPTSTESLDADNPFNNAEAEPEFLAVEDAYQLDVQANQTELLLSWQIADGYYLYNHRFKFTLSKKSLSKLT